MVTAGHMPPSPPNTPPVPCAPIEVTTCVSSVILLADPDTRVGLVGLVSHGAAPTVELTSACEVAAASTGSARSVLDPQTCADLQQSVLNLQDPAAALLTAQIGDRVNRSVAPSVSGPTPPGPGGGAAAPVVAVVVVAALAVVALAGRLAMDLAPSRQPPGRSCSA